MAKLTGWLPAQHGAWAMLAVPYAVGLLLVGTHRALGWGEVSLGATWLVGYFAYNACVLVLKSPAKRRAPLWPPLAFYGAGTGVAGLVTLLLLGPTILWWVPLYAVLLGVSLWLAASKRERSLTSGVLTVLASCALMGVLRATVEVAWSWPEGWVMFAVTTYFVGTVFHVKSLIRERNNPSSARRNLWFHLTLTVVIVAAVVLGWLPWPWLLWTAALVGRTLLLPRAPRRPMVIGLVEMGASLWLLGLAAFTLAVN